MVKLLRRYLGRIAPVTRRGRARCDDEGSSLTAAALTFCQRPRRNRVEAKATGPGAAGTDSYLVGPHRKGRGRFQDCRSDRDARGEMRKSAAMTQVALVV